MIYTYAVSIKVEDGVWTDWWCEDSDGHVVNISIPENLICRALEAAAESRQCAIDDAAEAKAEREAGCCE